MGLKFLGSHLSGKTLFLSTQCLAYERRVDGHAEFHIHSSHPSPPILGKGISFVAHLGQFISPFELMSSSRPSALTRCPAYQASMLHSQQLGASQQLRCVPTTFKAHWKGKNSKLKTYINKKKTGGPHIFFLGFPTNAPRSLRPPQSSLSRGASWPRGAAFPPSAVSRGPTAAPVRTIRLRKQYLTKNKPLGCDHPMYDHSARRAEEKIILAHYGLCGTPYMTSPHI